MPADEKEALSSDLMGLFEKRRFKNFLVFVQDFDESDPKTWKDVDPHKTTMEELYKKHGLDENTCDFVGHALALYRQVDLRVFFQFWPNKKPAVTASYISMYSLSKMIAEFWHLLPTGCSTVVWSNDSLVPNMIF